jgi:selenoprotein W-related protein
LAGETRSESAGARAEKTPARPRVEITYCAKCRFLPRAAWMAQELLTTFAGELGEIALVPGDGGVFQVRVAGELVACRARDGGFPELAELKRRIRDRVAPGRELGHSERP